MSDAHDPPQANPAPDDNRRQFFQVVIGGMTCMSVGTVGYPIVSFLKLPELMIQDESIEVLLADLEKGGATWGERRGQQIVIIKTDGGARAFNGACPHLGCVVQWDEAGRIFKCPCHGAIFNDHGEPVAGPVNKPLKRVEFKVTDGVLKIT